MASIEVPLANVIAQILETPVVSPIVWDENTSRWTEDVDHADERATVIEVGPVSSFFRESRNHRESLEPVERSEWTWRAVVGFHRRVDATAYEEALRTPIRVTGDDLPPFVVSLQESARTDPISGSEEGNRIELRFTVDAMRG